MILALTIAVLFGGGVYLIQQRGMVRIVFGMSLIGHAANLTILYAGVPAWRGEAFPDRTALSDAADPLPQAFVLTAIVIAMATTTIMLALAALGRNDDTHSVEPDDDQSPLTTTARSMIKPGHQSVAHSRATAAHPRGNQSDSPAVGDAGVARDTRATGTDNNGTDNNRTTDKEGHN